MSEVTAKVRCYAKTELHDGAQRVQFNADYGDERNKEWSHYTPALALDMTLSPEAGHLFEQGKAYTLTFSPEE